MLLDDALNLVTRLIDNGETHADYERTKALAETYRIYITGEGIDKKLIQFVKREEKDLFEQRLKLTRSITPAIASSIRQPFNKVTRNDRIRKTIKLKTESRKQAVETMLKTFYGSARKKNRGLEYWLKTRFLELQFIDPNAWVVIEWDAVDSPGEVIQPRPFEVPAANALNYFAANDEVKWLFCSQDINYKIKTPVGDHMGGTEQKPPGYVQPDNATTRKAGKRFTLYDEDLTLVFEEMDAEVLRTYVLEPGELTRVIKEKTYLVRNYQPNLGFAPVFRVGYKRDEVTSGRTFVNPWHDALCYFDKSLKTVSELDLTMTLHTFPQKLQYVQKCTGREKKRCNQGVCPDGTTCGACNGAGYKVHTTAQDAILLPMPDTPQDMINLDQVLVYKAPPIELIKFQNEYTQQLERQAHQAVFNSQAFVKTNGPNSPETATKIDNDMQSVYDALEPFTEKYSEVWRDFVITFGRLADEPLDDIDAVHEFPADYKLKTAPILLAERKASAESGAPAFLIETIDDDLAGIVYAGDQLGLQRYRVKRRYFPFTGKNEDEVAALLTSEFVPLFPKVLYSNFDQIFKELEVETPEFWLMTNVKKQRELVIAKVQEWIEKIKADNPAPDLDKLRFGNPANGDGQGEGGDGGGEGTGNPGEDGTAGENDDDVNDDDQK